MTRRRPRPRSRAGRGLLRRTTLACSGVFVAALITDTHSFFSVVLSIVGIGALIALHEAGHFFACRLTGTRVETFSIGFGPRLFGWERVGTGPRRFTVGRRRVPAEQGDAFDLRIAAIPLGGYVKMAGEIGGDGTATSGAGLRAQRPDDFPSKSIPQRAFIAVAGVVMNLITAIVFFSVAYGVGFSDASPIVGDVRPGGPAWKAGLRSGDRVLSYDGERVRTHIDVRQEVALAPKGETAVIEFERDGKVHAASVTPTVPAGAPFQDLGFNPATSLRIKGDDGTSLTIGPRDRATVDGRPVVGGAKANDVINEVIGVGRSSVTIEVPDGRRVQLSLARIFGKEASSGPYKLGVDAASRLVVAVLGPQGLAQGAGLAVGDEILLADAEPVRRLSDLTTRPSITTLLVRRKRPEGSIEVPLSVSAKDPAAVAALVDDIGVEPPAEKAEPRVAPKGAGFADGKSPAEVAGLRAGDLIVSIAGKPVKSWDDILAAGKSLDARPVVLVVRGDDGAERTLSVVPRRPRDPASDSPLVETVVEEENRGDGFADAVRLGVHRTWNEVRNVFRTIARFFSGDISFSKNVQGPLSITKFSSGAVGAGLGSFLAFLAYISVNLAVLNILPVPILDGGTLLILGIEGITRRKVPEAWIARFQLIGFGLLLLLMFFALRNDAKNLFGF